MSKPFLEALRSGPDSDDSCAGKANSTARSSEPACLFRGVCRRMGSPELLWAWHCEPSTVTSCRAGPGRGNLEQ